MSHHVYFAISLISLVIIIYTEPQYSESLFNKSLEVIPKLQEGSEKGDFKVIMWSIYSNGGIGLAMALPIIIP